MTPDGIPNTSRIPIRGDLLSGFLTDLSTVRLAGCRCTTCGETSFGRKTTCPNCGGESVRDVDLSTRGTLWTYTVVRHRPPGDYRGPEPFVPFGLGLVDLPDGVRVLSPIAVEIESLRIGMPLRFRPYVRQDADGREVIAFTFEANEND